jgi:chemotaxis protein MotA
LKPTAPARSASRRPDFFLLAGAGIAVCAIIAGMISTGIGAGYFLQPAGALIVLGGTLGVTLITTPPRALLHSLGRVRHLLVAPASAREEIIDEIVRYARLARRDGIMALERLAPDCSDLFLRDSLLLALDVKDRVELQSALEMELRLRERQGEADARTFEVAGGFAPTLGIIGTVVGLIEVLRHFSDIQAVGAGIGTAFVSTMYGLALANLFLLPVAHRIRARVAERLEVQELMAEGVLCLIDGVHPALIRLRLKSFLRESVLQRPAAGSERVPAISAVNG